MATDIETQGATEIPAGSWTVDPVHSVAGFAVRHMMVGTFRGEFTEIDATLTDGKLIGKVKVASLQIKDENLKGHLFSPDFFDVERYPEIVYESSSLAVNDGALTSEGTLTVSAQTPDVGEASEAVPVPFHGEAFEIGFNPDFLRDGLESIESDELVLKLISPLRPGLIESPDSGDFVYLIMPIRLNV